MFEFVLTEEVESNGPVDGEGKSKWVFFLSPLQKYSGRRLTQIKLAIMQGPAVDAAILFFIPVMSSSSHRR